MNGTPCQLSKESVECWIHLPVRRCGDGRAVLEFHPGQMLAHVDGKHTSFCSYVFSFDKGLVSLPLGSMAKLEMWSNEDFAFLNLHRSWSCLVQSGPRWEGGLHCLTQLCSCLDISVSRAVTLASFNPWCSSLSHCRWLWEDSCYQLLIKALKRFLETGEEPDLVLSESWAALWSPGYSWARDGHIWQCGEGVRPITLSVSIPLRHLQCVLMVQTTTYLSRECAGNGCSDHLTLTPGCSKER